MTDHKIRTCFWFSSGGAEAARFYTGLVPGSHIETDLTGNPDPMIVNFTLAGTPYQILTAGTPEKPTEATSISILCDDQEEVDRLWAALTADGGREIQCGWLTDRYGVSWQVVPRRALALFGAEDRAAANRAMQAMMDMKKLDIAALEAAFDSK